MTAQEVVKDDIWSVKNLKKLTSDELIDRLQQVDNQATLIRWFIIAEIRSRFSSDKLFGQYISTQDILRGKSSSAIYHECNAGRWCINNNVTDLNRLGIKKSVVYILASPKNKDISNKLFIKLKNKHYSINEVESIIEQERSITIEKEVEKPEPEPDRITYHEHVEPYTIIVKDGIAIEQKQLPTIDTQPLLQHRDVSTHVELVDHVFEDEEDIEYETYVEQEKPLSEDAMISKVLELVNSFNVSNMIKMKILTVARNDISNSTYRKNVI